VIYEFADGWTIRRIRRLEDQQREGHLMRTCLRDLDPDQFRGPDRYSLRDSDNLPAATFVGWAADTTDPYFDRFRGRKSLGATWVVARRAFFVGQGPANSLLRPAHVRRLRQFGTSDVAAELDRFPRTDAAFDALRVAGAPHMLLHAEVPLDDLETGLLFKFLGEGDRYSDGASVSGDSIVKWTGSYETFKGWPLPKDGRPGKWLKVEPLVLKSRRGTIKVARPLVPDSVGFHLCAARNLCEWIGATLWIAEAGKERIEEPHQIVVRRARLIRRVDTWNEKTARLFAADCAEHALKRERKAGREPDERSWDAVRVVRAHARGRASADDLAGAYAAAARVVSAAEGELRGTAFNPFRAGEAISLVMHGAAVRAACKAAQDGPAWAACWSAAREAARAGDARADEWDEIRAWQNARLLGYLGPLA